METIGTTESPSSRPWNGPRGRTFFLFDPSNATTRMGDGNREPCRLFFHSWSFILLNSQYGCGRLQRVFHLYPETPPDRKSCSGNIDPIRRLEALIEWPSSCPQATVVGNRDVGRSSIKHATPANQPHQDGMDRHVFLGIAGTMPKSFLFYFFFYFFLFFLAAAAAKPMHHGDSFRQLQDKSGKERLNLVSTRHLPLQTLRETDFRPSTTPRA